MNSNEIYTFSRASDIQDLKIVKDADSARMCSTGTNVHVMQLHNGKKDNAKKPDSDKPVSQDPLARSLKSMHVHELERFSPSASSSMGATNISLAKSNSGTVDSSFTNQVQSSSGIDVRKSTVMFVSGPQSRQSPNHRLNNAVSTYDNDAGRLQPNTKGISGRMKSSPVNGANGSYVSTQSGLVAMRRNDYSMPNCENDAHLNARKRTTSGKLNLCVSIYHLQ